MKNFEKYLSLYNGTPRKISSMSVREFNQLTEGMTIGIIRAFKTAPEFKDRPWHIIILENRIQTNTLLFTDALVLIEAGFWVFGDEYFAEKFSIEET